MNSLKKLEEYGQSVWLDYLSRGFVQKGELKKLVERDGLKGVTSNPAIFEKAIGHSSEYDEEIGALLKRGITDAGAIFRRLAVADIRAAADVLKPVYVASKGVDGYISMEVSPYIANDTEATLAEARDLWREIDRENLMIKIPATRAGIPAIQEMIGEGVNINITLLFAQSYYAEVAEAYLKGLEALPTDYDLSKIASVASFFVSRIDSKADALLEEKLKTATGEARTRLENLRGKVAVANAKLAYEHYQKTFAGPRWEALVKRGARPQRLLWASTGTKNKAYSDVLYVETLIGRDTVNTMPGETMDAFRDHGNPAETLTQDVAQARAVLADLKAAGISLDAITDELVIDGVEKFADAADQLYGAIASKSEQLIAPRIAVTYTLGEAQGAVDAEIKSWTKKGNSRRLWARDKTLWTGADESKWLGWLDIASREQAELAALRDLAALGGKYTDVALLGMGGSSLGSEVISLTLAPGGKPRFHILDSTDPDQIHALDKAITLETTLFVVSSKSGSTLEPNIFKDYYYHRVAQAVGAARVGSHFIAVTDPGSSLEKTAKAENFAHIFYGDSTIGGRYSVLSKFGLVPAALMGVDMEKFLAEAVRMQALCGPFAPPTNNPGLKLGIALGVLASKYGRDKITIAASGKLSSFGAWLEQLIAESTGKIGKGAIPVDGEPLGAPEVYGNDRVFVGLSLGEDSGQSTKLKALAAKGHPVIEIALTDVYQLAQLFFQWEIATAALGAVIGINPFDQPDVEAAKVKTRALMEGKEKPGAGEKEIFAGDGISVHADAANAAAVGLHADLAACLKAHLARTKPGDYLALLAYVERSAKTEDTLRTVQAKLRDATKASVCLGFGPRFLHSTGQAYKGGPNTGVFLQITGDHPDDIAVPGKTYSFGAVEDAQAGGDLAVLAERSRRAIRIHLKDSRKGLAVLSEAISKALH